MRSLSWLTGGRHEPPQNLTPLDISPQDFADLRHQASMTRKEAALALDVTPRTVQNWETGGARIRWMAYRMLRILRGYALPGSMWEGWTIRNDELFSPNGRSFDAVWLQNAEHVFSQARLLGSRLTFAQAEQQREAQELISAESLNSEAARRYIATSLKREFASENGTELNAVLPKMSPLNPQYLTKKQSVFQKIAAFVEKFKGVGGQV